MFRKRRRRQTGRGCSGAHRNRHHGGGKPGVSHRAEPGGGRGLGRLSPTTEAVVLKIYQASSSRRWLRSSPVPCHRQSRVYTGLELLKVELALSDREVCHELLAFDLRDYFLKELTDPQQRQVEAHVRTCQPCGKS